MAKILLVDDDHEICELLSQFLHKYNFHVSLAHDGHELFAALSQSKPDLIILDMMLPGDDGLTLCRKLREQYGEQMPILILSAAGEETDRIIGLEVGADDYIAKPFNPRELLARIRAILRRSNATAATSAATNAEPATRTLQGYRFTDWRLLTTSHELVNKDNEIINISSGEYALLLVFVTHPQKVLNRDQIMEITHDRDASPFDRSIDMQVSRLRQKIEANPKKPTLIKTIRGGGYMFTPEVAKLYG